MSAVHAGYGFQILQEGRSQLGHQRGLFHPAGAGIDGQRTDENVILSPEIEARAWKDH
jgi:hypothetical protein